MAVICFRRVLEHSDLVQLCIELQETSSDVIATFKRAFEGEPDAHPMVHMDRGAAYCSMDFNNYLTENKCVHSMSRPGHPWENSPMEHI
jgi:putative transposase